MFNFSPECMSNTAGSRNLWIKDETKWLNERVSFITNILGNGQRQNRTYFRNIRIVFSDNYKMKQSNNKSQSCIIQCFDPLTLWFISLTRLWRKGRYCPHCSRCHTVPRLDLEANLVHCSACDKYLHLGTDNSHH